LRGSLGGQKDNADRGNIHSGNSNSSSDRRTIGHGQKLPTKESGSLMGLLPWLSSSSGRSTTSTAASGGGGGDKGKDAGGGGGGGSGAAAAAAAAAMVDDVDGALAAEQKGAEVTCER
jgi:hypothetical protein